MEQEVIGSNDNLDGYGYDQGDNNNLGSNKNDKFSKTQQFRPPMQVSRRLFWKLCQENLHQVVAYCAVFWCFGMCVAFLGPTLLDLGCMTATSIKTLSWVFFAQLLCSLIGSISSGFIAKRVAANTILTISSCVLPIVMFLIPFCHAMFPLALVLAVMGLNMGCIDCLSNLQMIHLCGESVPPFLQMMHFFYGLGAFVSPMIAEPFLLNEDCSPLIENSTLASPDAPIGIVFANATFHGETLLEAQQETQVKYAFWILSILQVPIPFIMGSLVYKERKKKKEVKEQEMKYTFTEQTDYDTITKNKEAPDWAYATAGKNEPGAEVEDKSKFQINMKLLFGIASMTALMCFIYDGMQSAYAGYIYTYAVKSVADLNKTEGAYLNACFWGMFALGRLLSIFAATRLTSEFMLLVNIIGCLISQALMLTMHHDHIALYIGTCLFGIFLSSVTPTAISLAEKYIDVTSFVISYIVIIAAVGEMIFPVIVGNLFESTSPVSFLWFGNVACLFSVFIYGGIWFLGRMTPKHQATKTGSFVFTRLNCYNSEANQENINLDGCSSQNTYQATEEQDCYQYQTTQIRKLSAASSAYD